MPHRSEERSEVGAGAYGVCADRAASGWIRRSRSWGREDGAGGLGRRGRKRAPVGHARIGLCRGVRRC